MSDSPNVAIFWDYENCNPPSSSAGLGYDIVNNIRRIARLFGSVTTFRAYLDISAQSQSSKSVALRSELQSSGVSMIDCPHNGKKDVVDKMVLVDMLAFAVDHPAPATVILITGDRDYSYAVSTLRLRKYQVVLVVPSSPHVLACLENQASLVIDWGVVTLRSRTETSMQTVRQHYPDLDPNLTIKVLRELQELALDDPDATLLHPCYAASPGPSRLRRTSARDLLEHSKHSKNAASFDTVQELGYSHAKSTSGSDLALGMLPIPKTPSRSRGASVSTGSARARGATIIARSLEDNPPKNPPPSSARRSSTSDIADAAGSAKRSLSVCDSLELPLPDNRPPSSINIRSPLEPDHTTDMPEACSSYKLNCLASPFETSKGPSALKSIPNPSSKRPQTTIESTSPIVTPGKTLVETGTGMCKAPQTPVNGVPTETKYVTSQENGDEQSIPYRVQTQGKAPNTTDTPNHHSCAASRAMSPPPGRNMGTPLSDTSLSQHVSLPAVDYLGPSDAVDLAQLQFAALSRASNALDHSTRGFESVSSSASLSASLPHREPHERDERERHQTWTMFRPLIYLLLAAREKGIARSPRSMIAMELVQLDKQVYQHVGVSRFRDYTALAERAGIIELGGKEADAWIALHPDWFGQDGLVTTYLLSNRTSSPTSDPLNGAQNPLLMRTQPSLTETPVIVPTPVPPKPDSFQSRNTHTSVPTDRHDSAAVSDQFQPLIDVLIRLHDEGAHTALRSLIGQSLGQHVYAQAGVSGFKEYIQQAADAQLVECGGVGGHAWIRLYPGLRAKGITPRLFDTSNIDSDLHA